MDDVKRIVVKVGTAVISEPSGRISPDRVESLVEELALAEKKGIDVALVSSGAIAAGMERMGLESRPTDMPTLQAVASVGQGMLAHIYSEAFGRRGITAGQVLLTQHDLAHRQQYLNARHTIERLLEMGAVPVINENDTVSTEEISFGDNDLLASLVAALVRADVLFLLTDTAGLYDADPRREEGARLIERVERINERIEELGGESASELSMGGMSSKIQAAKIAVSSGVNVVIADGGARSVATALEGGRPGTFFPSTGKVASKKHWIGYAKRSKGKLVVDTGAAKALVSEGGSLLPVGVVGVEGDFDVGDAVDIVDEAGRLLGKGLSNYDHAESSRIAGLRSGKVLELLGECEQEIVHRDYMVIFERGTMDE